jgi:large subunit ribosomal protein L15
MYKRFRKLGFHNPNKKDFQTVSLEKIQEYIDMGRLTPKPNTLLTMRDLVYSGIVNRAKEGIKVLATGKEKLTSPIHLEVTSASLEAIKAVEAAGGTVTAVHFNR